MLTALSLSSYYFLDTISQPYEYHTVINKSHIPTDWIDQSNLQSSAKEYYLAKCRLKVILFIKIMNKSGDRWEPCGTPEETRIG